MGSTSSTTRSAAPHLDPWVDLDAAGLPRGPSSRASSWPPAPATRLRAGHHRLAGRRPVGDRRLVPRTHDRQWLANSLVTSPAAARRRRTSRSERAPATDGDVPARRTPATSATAAVRAAAASRPASDLTGEIVVCDRGTYGRVEKGQNVVEGGAGGMSSPMTQPAAIRWSPTLTRCPACTSPTTRACSSRPGSPPVTGQHGVAIGRRCDRRRDTATEAASPAAGRTRRAGRDQPESPHPASTSWPPWRRQRGRVRRHQRDLDGEPACRGPPAP